MLKKKLTNHNVSVLFIFFMLSLILTLLLCIRLEMAPPKLVHNHAHFFHALYHRSLALLKIDGNIFFGTFFLKLFFKTVGPLFFKFMIQIILWSSSCVWNYAIFISHRVRVWPQAHLSHCCRSQLQGKSLFIGEIWLYAFYSDENTVIAPMFQL